MNIQHSKIIGEFTVIYFIYMIEQQGFLGGLWKIEAEIRLINGQSDNLVSSPNLFSQGHQCLMFI